MHLIFNQSESVSHRRSRNTLKCWATASGSEALRYLLSKMQLWSHINWLKSVCQPRGKKEDSDDVVWVSNPRPWSLTGGSLKLEALPIREDMWLHSNVIYLSVLRNIFKHLRHDPLLSCMLMLHQTHIVLTPASKLWKYNIWWFADLENYFSTQCNLD